MPEPSKVPDPPKPEPKQAVPDQAKLAESAKTLRGRFVEDYNKTGTADLIFLAKKLAQLPPTDPDFYVALREARDLAAQAGDLATSIGAVDRMADSYEIDRLAMKAEAAGRAASNLKTKARSALS